MQMQHMVTENGGEVLFVADDVASEASAKNMVKAALKCYGRRCCTILPLRVDHDLCKPCKPASIVPKSDTSYNAGLTVFPLPKHAIFGAQRREELNLLAKEFGSPHQTRHAHPPWIGTDGYCPFESLTADLFQQRGLAYHHVVHSHDEPTKTELVAAGVGLAMLERSEAEEAQQTGRLMIWETDTLYCDLYFAYVAKRRDDPLIKALRTAVLHIWKHEEGIG